MSTIVLLVVAVAIYLPLLHREFKRLERQRQARKILPNLRDLHVRITADTRAFTEALQRASAAARVTTKDIERLAEKLAPIGDDYRRQSVLFNDITHAPNPNKNYFPFSHRQALADYLWTQGWRRDVRPEDINTRPAKDSE